MISLLLQTHKPRRLPPACLHFAGRGLAQIRKYTTLISLLAALHGPAFMLTADCHAMRHRARIASNATVFRFDFGPGALAAGYQRVMPGNTYNRETGYGFEPGPQIACIDRGGKDPVRSDFCTSDQPFYFSVALPEGNYNVSVTFGDAQAESVTTVKAELRRLMIEKVETKPGKFETRTFTVNVRTPLIAGDGEVQRGGAVGFRHRHRHLLLQQRAHARRIALAHGVEHARVGRRRQHRRECERRAEKRRRGDTH